MARERRNETEEERRKVEELLEKRERTRKEIGKKEEVVKAMISRLRQLQFDLSTLLTNPKTLEDHSPTPSSSAAAAAAASSSSTSVSS